MANRKVVDERLPRRCEKKVPMVVCTRTGGDNSAAFTRALATVPNGSEIVGVDLIPSGAVAQAAANYWTFELKAGATSIAAIDTEDGGDGVALSAETNQAMTLTSTLADRKVSTGDLLSLVGTPANPGNGADLSGVDLTVCIRFQPTGE